MGAQVSPVFNIQIGGKESHFGINQLDLDKAFNHWPFSPESLVALIIISPVVCHLNPWTTSNFSTVFNLVFFIVSKTIINILFCSIEFAEHEGGKVSQFLLVEHECC